MSKNIFKAEDKMFSIIEKEATEKGKQIIRTSKGYSRIDGIVCEKGIIRSIMECKSKLYLDFSKNQEARAKGWLIDWKKVQSMALVAKSLCVPAYLYGYIPLEKKIFVWLIADDKGEIRNCSEIEQIIMSESSITRKQRLQKVTYLQFSKACKVLYEEEINL